MEKLVIFIKRLNKIGIDVILGANYPWIYLSTINGYNVDIKYRSDYYFTLGFMSIKSDDFTFSDISEIFQVIRIYRDKSLIITDGQIYRKAKKSNSEFFDTSPTYEYERIIQTKFEVKNTQIRYKLNRFNKTYKTITKNESKL